MSNPIYKAQDKPYTEDINDLIEKGGVGSGQKGHTTNKQVTRNKYGSKMGLAGKTSSGKEVHFHNAKNIVHANYSADDHHDAVRVIREHLEPDGHRAKADSPKDREHKSMTQFINEHKAEAEKKGKPFKD